MRNMEEKKKVKSAGSKFSPPEAKDIFKYIIVFDKLHKYDTYNKMLVKLVFKCTYVLERTDLTHLKEKEN